MDYPEGNTTTEASKPATVPAIGRLAAALAAAQADMKNPIKSKTARVAMKAGGTYTYSYADLADVIEAVREPLSRNSLAFVQLIETTDKTAILKTTLMHASGESVCSTYPLPYGAAAQEMGSAITYARRYSLSALLGLAAEEDDDGAQAQNVPPANTDREADELIERMGAASIGNHALMEVAGAWGLGEGKTIADLSKKAIAALLDRWTDVLKAVKEQKAKDAELPYPKAEPPKQEPPKGIAPKAEPKKTEKPAAEGIDHALAALMEKSGITPAGLKAYYVGKGHFPATVEPDQLPDHYVKKITAAWSQALPSIKKGQQ